MLKLTIGESVNYNGHECRVVATSGLDSQCIVEWFVLGSRRDSGWIDQNRVTRDT